MAFEVHATWNKRLEFRAQHANTSLHVVTWLLSFQAWNSPATSQQHLLPLQHLQLSPQITIALLADD